MAEFEGEFNQINRSSDAFFDTKGSFVARHIGLYKSRAADIGLDLSANHIFVLTKDSVVNVDSEFRDSITPFRPSLLSVSVVGHSDFEFTKNVKKILLSKIGILKSLFEILIGDSLKSHYSCC